MAEGDLDEAEKMFRKASEVDPELTLAQFNLGIVLNKQLKYRRAVPVFEKVLEAEPNNLECYLYLGTAYSASGELSKALSLLEQARQTFPQEARIYLKLSELYEELDMKDKQLEAQTRYSELTASS